MVFVRCKSHRDRKKLFSLLGYAPQGYWSWDDYATGGFYLIPEDKLEAARKIRGVCRVRKTGDLRECIDWSRPT